MGMGFAYIAPTLKMAEEMVKLIAERGEHRAQIIGEVRAWKGEGLRTILHNPYEGPPVEYVGY
jgi:phosphoribosylaminoimidazole (AIR) synthetase